MLNHTKQLVRVLYLVRLRALLGLAGIDISRFKPHSVRASSTSAATLAKVLLDAILRTAGWSRHSTFAKYYKRKPKNMRIWQKLKFDGNSIESSWGARDDMPTLTCIWNKPTNIRVVRLSKLISGIGLRNLMWLAPHDDSIELPSNFNL